jgi:hypothetical protein
MLDSALSDALSNHVFGAQHIQQLQVIQRLQQQRAAMLAARAAQSASSQQPTQQQQQQPSNQQQQQQPQQQTPQTPSQANVIIDPQTQGEICPECTQCSECAAAKLAELEAGGECCELINFLYVNVCESLFERQSTKINLIIFHPRKNEENFIFHPWILFRGNETRCGVKK